MRETDSQLKDLADISTDILLICGVDGRIEFCNRRCKHLFGEKMPKGRYFADFFEPQNAARIRKELKLAFSRSASETFQLRQASRIYNFYIHPRRENTLICIEDITERSEISLTLDEQSARLKFAEKTAKLGYWEVDLKSKKIFWSAEMFRIFNIDAAKTSAKNNIIKKGILPEDLPVYKQKLRDLLISGRPVEGTVRIKRKEGEIIDCWFRADLLHRQKDKIAGTFQDLTELLNIQRKLEAAQKEAERSNRAKSYFLAQASHDLRQPLQALAIFVNALTEEQLSPEQKEIVDKIDASTRNLRTLMDNLLDISKLEAGGIKAHKIFFNLGRMVDNILQEYQALVQEKGIILKKASCCRMVYSDPILIERILRNFLSNAFKYTRSKILAGCRIHNKKLRIMVADNGAGIAEDEISAVFKEFYQSNKIPDNKKKGSGLGLTIVKKTAAVIGADVGVTSRFGRGSCFYLDLDL